MAAQPSPTVLAAMATVGDVFDWVPIKDAFREAVCTELGVAAGDPVRTLANIDEGDLHDAKKTIKIGERALNAAERGKVGSAWRTSRLAAKMEKTTAETETGKKEAITAAKEKLVLLKEQVEIQKKTLTNTVGQVNLAETLVQTLTGAIPVLSQAELIAAHDVYELLMEGPCPKDEKALRPPGDGSVLHLE